MQMLPTVRMIMAVPIHSAICKIRDLFSSDTSSLTVRPLRRIPNGDSCHADTFGPLSAHALCASGLCDTTCESDGRT